MITYAISIYYAGGHEEEPIRLNVTTDDAAIASMRKHVATARKIERKLRPAEMLLSWFRDSDGCVGYLNPPNGDASPTGHSWI